MDYRKYGVNPRAKGELLQFILQALKQCDCTVLHHSEPSHAPLRLTFEAPDGERMGIVVYAFLANQRLTKNRPADEHRFQIKYGSKDGQLHELWQDPYELYTTLFVGINPRLGFFVGADPVLHSPTRFFISLEYKQEHVDAVISTGWAAWEREVRRTNLGLDEPVEILVGARPERFLRYVRFERAARGLDQGHRALLADKIAAIDHLAPVPAPSDAPRTPVPPKLHALATEFQLSPEQILDLVQSAPRLKMAVRGWVAEVHLMRQISAMPGITSCERIEEEGRPDLRVRLHDSRPVEIECKNILRKATSNGALRVDFQRTRASIADPCSRYYVPTDFDLVAACLHPRTEQWEFRYAMTRELDPHRKCAGRLSSRVELDARWSSDVIRTLERVLEH